MSSPAAPPTDPPPRVRPWTVWMLVAVILVGGLVGTQILFKKIVPEATDAQQRLPYRTRLNKDLAALEASGREINLSQLDGKVYLVGYVYTTCPRGCAGVVARMKELQAKFGSNPLFHLVSVSLNPEHDTPAQLTKFIEAQEIDRSNWWFVTGDPKALRYYMTKGFGFPAVRDIPPAERINEFDLYEHKLAIALVDAKSHVREYYSLEEPDAGIQRLVNEKMEKDIAAVLAEAQAEAAAGK